jgi:hypothetical protein
MPINFDYMERTTVRSSFIEYVQFETRCMLGTGSYIGTLTIGFKETDNVVDYYYVPEELYLAIINARSVGATYNALLRGNNRYPSKVRPE